MYFSPQPAKEVIMEVTKEQAVSVTAEIQEAVNAILAKHGLTGPKIKTTYGDFYKFTLEAFVKNEGDNGINLSSKEATYFKKFGYTAYDAQYNTTELVAPLGTIFKNKGVEYAFGGIASSRKKYPIVGINTANGTTMLFTDAMVPVINASAK
jgi:hypothetical protein